MKYLNLGCGNRFHKSWTNINFDSNSNEVMKWDLTKGIPFPDNFFDVVYHSHLLEHFTRATAKNFLLECSRVLRPQGVLRVVVPDLEQIVHTYIEALELANSGSEEWAYNYNWILMEMYDQTVRTFPGGEMAGYLVREHIPNEDFLLKRWGNEAKQLIETGHRVRQEAELGSKNIKHLLKPIYRSLKNSGYGRDILLKLLLGKEYNALKIGRYRQSGEIHQWMYDRYSLSVLLKECGLENIIQRSATDSYIPNWTSFNLDTDQNGTIYKPDSLFIEGIKL
jgi:predicted SAM-dependent methyltransferase